MKTKTTYGHLNRLLVDIVQQSASPWFALINQQKIIYIKEANKIAIEKMYAGIKALTKKYCVLDVNGVAQSANGKLLFSLPETEKVFYEEYNKLLNIEFEMTY